MVLKKVNKFAIFCLQATAEANNLAAVADAKSVYTTLMEEICGGGQPYLGEGHLVAEHFRIRDKAIFQVNIIIYFDSTINQIANPLLSIRNS